MEYDSSCDFSASAISTSRASPRAVTMTTLRSALPSPELRPYVRAYAQRVVGASEPDLVEAVPAQLEQILDFELGTLPGIFHPDGRLTDVANGNLEQQRPTGWLKEDRERLNSWSQIQVTGEGGLRSADQFEAMALSSVQITHLPPTIIEGCFLTSRQTGSGSCSSMTARRTHVHPMVLPLALTCT
jgi:hypothetical protein